MKRELSRLVAAQISIHAAMAGMRMAAPLLALQQGYGAASVGVLLALFALTPVFLALPAGRFADRRGLRAPVMLSVTLASGGMALAVAWPVFGVLCFAALCTGAASGTAVIALQRHVGVWCTGPPSSSRRSACSRWGPQCRTSWGRFWPAW